jgi:arsenate reductase (thioredoxin)
VRTVLFVCDGNTFRSVLAEAIFNSIAPEDWVAESAGLHAGDRTSPAALDLLRSIGIARAAVPPRTVTLEQVERADPIISFTPDPRLPGHPEDKVEHWPVPGGMGKTDVEREQIRDEIRRRVEGLVTQLPKEDSKMELEHD